MSYLPIPDRLRLADTVLTNALADPILLDAVATYGYDAAALEEGRSLLVAARQAQQAMRSEYGEQYDATDAVRDAFDAANSTYMQHVKLARIAVKDRRGAATALQLVGARKQSIRGWLDQATTFYDNALANEDIQADLARFNITPEVLAEGQAAVEAVARANSQQEQEKGDAQAATAVRDDAVEALDEWMSEFRVAARVALEDEPQQLEKLGIRVPAS
jgi:hypothetical protein